MKITLWQQFSSNHSNGFTLVGVFPSVAQAKKAYQRIDKLLKAIDKWRTAHPDDYRYDFLTPPEKRIAATYEIDWEEPTENVSIRQFQAIIEIDAFVDSWTRRAPYELLLQAFGADVAGWDNQEQSDDLSEPSIYRAQISATAKTEAEAIALTQTLQEKLRQENLKQFNIFAGTRISNDGLQIRIENLAMRHIQFFAGIVQDLETVCDNVHYTLLKQVMNQSEM
jgi:hypothetical protein